MQNALQQARQDFQKQMANPFREIVDSYRNATGTAPVEKKPIAAPVQPTKAVATPTVETKLKVKVQKPERMKKIEKKPKSYSSDASLAEKRAKVQKQMKENSRKEQANLFLGSLPADDEPVVRQLSYGFSADPETLPSHDLKIMVELIREASTRLKTQDKSKVLKYIISEGDKIGGDMRWRSLLVRWSM